MAYNTFLSSLIGQSSSLFGSLIANSRNKQIAQMNINAQKQINAQNLAYQKQEAEITRAREDTAVQRAMADTVASGLSKTLATGNTASANYMNPYSKVAPQSNFHYDSALEKLNLGNFIIDLKNKIEDFRHKKKVNDFYDENPDLNPSGTDTITAKNYAFIKRLVGDELIQNITKSINNANSMNIKYKH